LGGSAVSSTAPRTAVSFETGQNLRIGNSHLPIAARFEMATDRLLCGSFVTTNDAQIPAGCVSPQGLTDIVFPPFVGRAMPLATDSPR
jgi:hypothetical protein